nr:hypothetical protein [Tanacetum cinerariifolium]
AAIGLFIPTQLTSSRSYLTDIRAGFCYIKHTVGIYGEPSGIVKPRAGYRPVGRARGGRARHRTDHAVGRNLTNAVVDDVGKVHIALLVSTDTRGSVEFSGATRA